MVLLLTWLFNEMVSPYWVRTADDEGSGARVGSQAEKYNKSGNYR